MRGNEYSIERHLDYCCCGADFDSDIECTCGYYESDSEVENEHDLENRMQHMEVDLEDIMPW
jgi:hypothetical protein